LDTAAEKTVPEDDRRIPAAKPLRGAILHSRDAFLLGAMSTAIDFTFCLDPVADDAAVAVGATRRHGLDGAFETVKRHAPIALHDLEGFIVVVAALIALCHVILLE
jgi:hypothetical protein